MSAHALLSASSAHRWLNCTPSARLEEPIPDSDSTYAAEGTLAHRLGELTLRSVWEGADAAAPGDFDEVTNDPMYCAEMREHIDSYSNYVAERMAEAKSRCDDPLIFIEKRIDYSDFVPEGFGTADCVIIADGSMEVIDLKYGAGIRVSAEGNPQMELYALGCLAAFDWLYDIREVKMTVFQPRIDSISTAVISANDLIAWAGSELRIKADLAYRGAGDFCPGEKTCKWCKIGDSCRARAEYQLELAKLEFAEPPMLSPEEIGDILTRLPGFIGWAEQVKGYALDIALNHGVRIPGWKTVEGRSNRKYKDEAALASVLTKAGYADIYQPQKLWGITAMEKQIGKKKFNELAEGYVIKPEGAPTLVPESDNRPEINCAAAAAKDFE